MLLRVRIHPSHSPTPINGLQSQGITLLSQSQQESFDIAQTNDKSFTPLTRQLYLHGLSYALRSVPSDLTQEEILSLHAATPPAVHNLQIALQSHSHALTQTQIPHRTRTSHEGPVEDPSFLHRATAYIVFQSFLFLQFILPYIKLFLGHAYRWERKHHVTERLVDGGIVTVERGVQLSQTVCQMNDGKVGQAVNNLTFWFLQGITGGIQQGICEGVGSASVGRGKSVVVKNEEKEREVVKIEGA
jgi:hypothetical protein